MENKDYVPDYQQFPSEFLSEGDMYQLFMNHGFVMGRMLSGSKSLYRQNFPDHDVIFNANIVIESKGKVWHGDLDVTLDYDKLQNVADALEEPLYILYEMDARFENENAPIKLLISKAKFKIEYNGNNNSSTE